MTIRKPKECVPENPDEYYSIWNQWSVQLCAGEQALALHSPSAAGAIDVFFATGPVG